jgi:hypothetical protein
MEFPTHRLARFACIEADESWLEDLLMGGVDKIEEIIYVCCQTSL